MAEAPSLPDKPYRTPVTGLPIRHASQGQPMVVHGVAWVHLFSWVRDGGPEEAGPLLPRRTVSDRVTMLHTVLGAFGAIAFLALCLAGEHVNARLRASGLHAGGRLIGD
jgi:hypothetical protein